MRTAAAAAAATTTVSVFMVLSSTFSKMYIFNVLLEQLLLHFL